MTQPNFDGNAGVSITSPGSGGGGGGGSLLAFPNRIDISVNKAQVDNAQSASPIMTVKTGTNNAGAFNGGGLGNKAILGIQGFDTMPLSALATLEIVWREMEAGHPNPIQVEVYANLIVEPDPIGAPGTFRIFSISNTLPPIFDFTVTPLGPGRWDYSWTASSPTNFVQVVGPVVGPPPPPFGTSFPPVVPFISNGPAFFSQAFRMSDILASYPNARLRDASTGDGGMPKTTVTPAILIIVGDSNNVTMASRLIEEVKLNGALI
jgi:hypothetical protein